MISLSFNLSVKLQEELDKIESIRRDILIIPISPQKKLSLRWQTTLTRLYFASSLDGRLIKKDTIEKVLTVFSQPILKQHEKDLAMYKKALDVISKDWSVTQKKIKIDDVLALYQLSCYGKLRVKKVELQEILDYLEKKDEHPVVTAAVAIIAISMIKPFSENNERFARLMGMLMLYKQGYDFRGLISTEELWSENIVAINQYLKLFMENSNITLWLEDFANMFLAYITKLREKLYSPVHSLSVKTDFSTLNDRQRAILYTFASPTIFITNKKIQAMYHISQITASRDLQKLTMLGLLAPHGKGRSIYYTRV